MVCGEGKACKILAGKIVIKTENGKLSGDRVERN